MCLTFHIRVVHFFGLLKKESIYLKNLFALTSPPLPKKKNKKKPGLPSCGTEIRCAQNWYATVQMVLKYPLPINWSNPFKPIHLLADATFNHSLMFVASYIVKTDLKKILTKLLILDRKIISPTLHMISIFLKNPDLAFLPKYNACCQVQLKEIISRLRKEFNRKYLNLKMPHLPHFWQNKNSQKGLYFVFNANFMHRIRKN